MQTCKGITAIELMVVMGILSILALMAVPSFNGILERQRLTGTTTALFSAMHLARSEAIKRNQRVTLCPSSDGATCREDGDWSHGWIWFADPENSGKRSADDLLIGHEAVALRGTLQITGNTPVRDYVSYIARGTTQRTNGALQMGSFTLCGTNDKGRRLVISGIGRVRTEKLESC